MAIEVRELALKRSATIDEGGNAYVRRFIVDGTNDPTVAVEYGPAYNSTVIIGSQYLYVRNKEATEFSPDSCLLSVTYRPGSGPLPGGLAETEELDLMGGTAHVNGVDAADDQRHFPEGDDVADTGLAIEVDKDGNVSGVDKIVPGATLRISTIVAVEVATSQWKRNVYSLRGKTNSATFRGWLPGELLFLGATLRRTGASDYMVTYTWSGVINASFTFPEVYGSSENGQEVAVEKTGHEYLWFTFVPRPEDTGAEKEIMQSVHVAKLYKESVNFATELNLDPEAEE